MERPRKSFLLSPHRQECDEFDGFLFVPDEDLKIPADGMAGDRTLTNSPRSPFRSSIIPTVMSALKAVVSSENLLVSNITKTMMAGAATTLSAAGIAGVPGVAVGALVAGGLYALRTLRNRSVIDVLKTLTPTQQKQLIMRLRSRLKLLGVQDLANEILNRSDVKDIALKILSEFLQEKYGLKIMRV